MRRRRGGEAMSYLPPDLRPDLLLHRTARFLDGLKRRPETEGFAPPLEAARAVFQGEHAERERRMTARDEAGNESNLAERDLRRAIRSLHRLAVRQLVASDQCILFPRGLKPELRPMGESLIAATNALLQRLDALHASLQERLAPGRAEVERCLGLFPSLLEASEQASAELGKAFQRERTAAIALNAAAHRAREEVRRVDPDLVRAICPRNLRRREADPDGDAA